MVKLNNFRPIPIQTFIALAMNGLFDDAAVAPVKGQEREKRIKLKNCDHVAAKALDPFGVSVIEDIALDALAEIAEKGDKFTKFFSEYFADNDSGGNYRKGIALSRFMGVCTEALNQLKTNQNLGRCLNANVLAKAVAEGDRLAPHFLVLNAGKGRQQGGDERQEIFGNVKRRKLDGTTGAPSTEQQIKASAKAIHEWILLGERSNFRMLLNFLSVGGVFYSFQAADKTSRAWVQTKHVDQSQMEAIALARHQEAAPAQSSRVKKEEAQGDLFAQEWLTIGRHFCLSECTGHGIC